MSDIDANADPGVEIFYMVPDIRGIWIERIIRPVVMNWPA